jgi:hypothetical protein
MHPTLRIGDADRDRTVAALRRHTADGRLSLDEFDQRAARAYAARTNRELAALTADLPPLSSTAPTHARDHHTLVPLTVAGVTVLAALALLAAVLAPAADAHAITTQLGAMCGMR